MYDIEKIRALREQSHNQHLVIMTLLDKKDELINYGLPLQSFYELLDKELTKRSEYDRLFSEAIKEGRKDND